MRAPRILLADCDQMFVAVARLVDPEGAGKAALLVVGGRAQSRGVVCSASYEVRAFGVRSGMPISRAARLCPAATFVPVPRQACVEKSREVRAVLADWSPVVEAASIDEFDLDLSGTEAVYRHESLDETARRIRTAVWERTGLRLSIGAGTNRLVAKLAAERAKPRPNTDGNGVLVVGPGDEAAFLSTHQLAEISGVGPKLQERLRKYGLASVHHALRIDRADLARWLGPRTGNWLYDRIRGRGAAAVDPSGAPKSISREETFAVDLPGDEAIETELVGLAARLGADLREDALRARLITVKLRDFDFKTRTASRTLSQPIDSNRLIVTVAKELLTVLRQRRRVAARLVGVSLSRLGPAAEASQVELLAVAEPTFETDRDRTLSRTMDQIEAKFGRGAVVPARVAAEPRRDRDRFTP